MDTTILYGRLLIFLGLILSLIYQIGAITKASSLVKGDISKNKRSVFSWFTFFSLTIMGSAILLINSFSDVVNYRLIWISTLEYDFFNQSDIYFIIIDLVFIFLVFGAMLLLVKRVRSGKGKFIIAPKNRRELFIVIFGFYPFGLAYLAFFFIIGASIILLVLSLIPTYMFSYIFKKGITY